MNAPERYERFVVPEGTKKQLQRYGNVVFSGCQLPHPLMYKIIVRAEMAKFSAQ
ncbi:hypothetical protein F2Q69_00056657 [Brassica cretica]|uniref:Uncharacterized protein n=1 Tax=Brassica cretica TaxID=69181 RepID=A0A8S9MW75_BRACR|nr:hypothetical protein F2Q69_00056657 [Brassica cretica]